MNKEKKPSGIEWANNIPLDWNTSSIKQLVSFTRREKNQKEDTTVLSLTISGVKQKTNLNEGMNPTTYIGHQLVYPGDLVICLRDLDGPLLVGISDYYGCISNLYSVLKFDNQNIEYYNFVFKTMGFIGVIDDYSYGMRHSYNISQFGQLILPVPKLVIQEKIVKKLNQLEQKIAQLIMNQQLLLEKLKEYKQSLISEIIKKGLNPRVKLKKSGIEWIGDIPTHYEIRKLKTCLIEKLQYGANSSGVAYDENLPRYIRITDITLDNELKDDGKLSLPIEEANNYILKDGDVLFARSGATVGKTFLFKEEYGYSAFAGYLIKASTDRSVLLPQYLYYFTLTSAYAEWVKQIFIQATIQNIGANKYSNLLLTVPSIEEQSNICDYLATIDKKFKHLEAVLQQKISKLIEYKESLIYEYVTGKKEVA